MLRVASIRKSGPPKLVKNNIISVKKRVLMLSVNAAKKVSRYEIFLLVAYSEISLKVKCCNRCYQNSACCQIFWQAHFIVSFWV